MVRTVSLQGCLPHTYKLTSAVQLSVAVLACTGPVRRGDQAPALDVTSTCDVVKLTLASEPESGVADALRRSTVCGFKSAVQGRQGTPPAAAPRGPTWKPAGTSTATHCSASNRPCSCCMQRVWLCSSRALHWPCRAVLKLLSGRAPTDSMYSDTCTAKWYTIRGCRTRLGWCSLSAQGRTGWQACQGLAHKHGRCRSQCVLVCGKQDYKQAALARVSCCHKRRCNITHGLAVTADSSLLPGFCVLDSAQAAAASCSRMVLCVLTCSDRSRICLSSYCFKRACAVLRALSSFTQRPRPTSATTWTATPQALRAGPDWLQRLLAGQVTSGQDTPHNIQRWQGRQNITDTRDGAAASKVSVSHHHGS